MATLRQQLLVLCLKYPSLDSEVCAWAAWDGTGREHHTTGDTESPPYPSALAAMQDGWRVIQFPQLLPAYPGMELSTAYLRFEYVLEKIVDTDIL